MDAVGTSTDNALAESFDAALKRETLKGARRFDDALDCRLAVFLWITRRNTRRRHSANGQRAPIVHGQQSAALTLAAQRYEWCPLPGDKAGCRDGVAHTYGRRAGFEPSRSEPRRLLIAPLLKRHAGKTCVKSAASLPAQSFSQAVGIRPFSLIDLARLLHAPPMVNAVSDSSFGSVSGPLPIPAKEWETPSP